MKKSVLFVDDDPFILQGLKRMLYSMSTDIDFVFVDSGDKALSTIRMRDIHVLITDMQMPGMDGLRLLKIVKKNHPDIIRMILTGYADQSPVQAALPLVHQILSKPSDAKTLKTVVSRACAIQDELTNQKLKTLVSGTNALPSLPEIYRELEKTLENPECSIHDIADIIGRDIAMSAKVLQLSNSTFYCFPAKVESLERAVCLVGLNTIKTLVLGAGLFSTLSASREEDVFLTELWSHSLAVAEFAKRIAVFESDDKTLVSNSFLAGILHDIGRVILFSSFREQYAGALETVKDAPLHLSQLERKIFGASHSEIGGFLIGIWGLPDPVVEATTFHHRIEKLDLHLFCPAIAVHAAEAIYYRLNPESSAGMPPVMNESYLESIGLKGKFEQWLELCQENQMEGEYHV